MDGSEKLLEIIAINVRNERFKQKLSQDDLANLAGVSVNLISNIENAKQNVGICNLNSIAIALRKNLKDLM